MAPPQWLAQALEARTQAGCKYLNRTSGFFRAKREEAHFKNDSEENMAAQLPDKYADLLTKKAFANLGTLNPDGSPQVTPVWVDYDGKHVRVNSARGRQKDKNIARDPRVSLSIQDPENPYRYVEIRGRVVEATEKGADDHINKLAKKYLGKDEYPYRKPGEQRVLYKIEPLKFSSNA
jgi:PPOX class probable F420-dependent enzyme